MLHNMLDRVLRRWFRHSPVGAYTEGKRAVPESLALDPSDAVFGVYANPAPFDYLFIVFTATALHYSDARDRWTMVEYDSIRNILAPGTKFGPESVGVETETDLHTLRATGTNQHNVAIDAWSLYNVLRKLLIARRVGLLQKRRDDVPR
jgi:hypothetical protein